MKIRRSIYWFCAGIIALLVFVVWSSKRPERITPSNISTVDVTNAVAVPRTNAAIVPQTTLPNSVADATTVQTGPVKSKEQKMGEILSTENDVPIVFYGKLEDQFGNPVAGAEITGNTIIYNGVREGTDRFTTTSDSSGFFKLDCGKGESLGVMPRKTGYALATTGTEFKYSHLYQGYHVPDPSNPVTIKMWKLQGAEPLIHFRFDTWVRNDGQPVFFDLRSGKSVASGGDLAIRVQSPTNADITRRYDWRVTIQAVEGGIIECTGLGFEKTFQAPESGYQSEFIIGFQKDTRPWSEGFNGGFYLMIKEGKVYGKIAVKLTTDVVKNGAVPVTLSGYLNPSGSRNLELDPKLVTEAHP